MERSGRVSLCDSSSEMENCLLSSSEMERAAGMGLESAPLSSSEMQPQDLVEISDGTGG